MVVTFLETMVFEVAVFRHQPDEWVAGKSVVWLIAEYERVNRARWNDTLDRIMATELGTSRALAQVLSKDKLPDLPSYEQSLRKRSGQDSQLPAWQYDFEAANPDAVQTTKTAARDD